jgi:hypothetical protein
MGRGVARATGLVGGDGHPLAITRDSEGQHVLERCLTFPCFTLSQHLEPMASTITFPSTESRSQLAKSDTSLVTRHATAVDVCNLVYGHADPFSWDTLSTFYEADAGMSSFMDLLPVS